MFSKSLGSILGSFTKVSKDLELFITKSTKEVDSITETLADLELKQESIAKDISRAKEVKQNISNLLNA